MKWRGTDKLTWESVENLEYWKDLVEEFDQSHSSVAPSAQNCGKRFKIKSTVTFSALLKHPSLSPLTKWITTDFSSPSYKKQMKSALTIWVTFLLQEERKSLKQLLISSPGLMACFADPNTNESFWNWYLDVTGHTHPSTLKNFVDKMRKMLDFLRKRCEDRFISQKLKTSSKFWQQHSSKFNKEATRKREYERRVTVIKDKGKFLTKEDWKKLSETANEKMDSIEEKFDSETMTNEAAKAYSQCLLWLVGLALGIPRTMMFTFMDIGETLIFRNGMFLHQSESQKMATESITTLL